MAKLIGGGIPEVTLEVIAATLNVEVTDLWHTMSAKLLFRWIFLQGLR